MAAPAATSSSSSSPSVPSDDSAIAARYESERLAEAAALRAMIFQSREWEQFGDSNGVKMYRWTEPDPDAEKRQFMKDKTPPPQRTIYKGTGIIEAPLALVVDFMRDTNNKKVFDSAFESATEVERLTPTIRIELQRYWCPFPLTSREFLILRQAIKLDEAGDVVYGFGRSVTSDAAPITPKYVRGLVSVGAWIFERLRPGTEENATDKEHTRLSFYGHTDLGGSIPAMIKSKLETKQPALVGQVREPIMKKLKELDEIKDEAEKKKRWEVMDAAIAATPLVSAETIAQYQAANASAKMGELLAEIANGCHYSGPDHE